MEAIEPKAWDLLRLILLGLLLTLLIVDLLSAGMLSFF